MESDNWKWWGQMFATLGVIVSLGFVAYELKLSRDIAVAELTLSIHARQGERELAMVDPKTFESSIRKLWLGEESTWTDEERRSFVRISNYELSIFDSLFLLHQLGLAPASEWKANEAFLKRMYKQSDEVKRMITTQLVRPAFKEELDRIAAEAQEELDSQ